MTGNGGLALKEALQLLVSGVAPFIAAGCALLIASASRKERISCFITFGYGHGYEEMNLIGVHNRSAQPVAIIAVRYRAGIIFRRPAEGTALEYEDPTELDFPYVVGAGEIRKIRLDDGMAARLAAEVGPIRYFIARAFRRSRLDVECQTTTGARYRTSGEGVLPWDDQVPWKRGH